MVQDFSNNFFYLWVRCLLGSQLISSEEIISLPRSFEILAIVDFCPLPLDVLASDSVLDDFSWILWGLLGILQILSQVSHSGPLFYLLDVWFFIGFRWFSQSPSQLFASAASIVLTLWYHISWITSFYLPLLSPETSLPRRVTVPFNISQFRGKLLFMARKGGFWWKLVILFLSWEVCNLGGLWMFWGVEGLFLSVWGL